MVFEFGSVGAKLQAPGEKEQASAAARVALARASEVRMTGSTTAAESEWYALYTVAHHEKRVAQQLQTCEVECFLPLYRSVRRWSDRSKELQLPLFPGYLFVHTDLGERGRILQLPSVVHFVCFNGLPAPVPITEIETLRSMLNGNAYVEPHPYLRVGRRVRVHSGPMAGLEGILTSKKGRLRIVLAVDLIRRSVAVEVGADEVEPLH